MLVSWRLIRTERAPESYSTRASSRSRRRGRSVLRQRSRLGSRAPWLGGPRYMLRMIRVVGALILAPAPVLAQQQIQQLRLVAPAAPGGGWDQTARAMQQALQRTRI